jgi:hypothetical protein
VHRPGERRLPFRPRRVLPRRPQTVSRGSLGHVERFEMIDFRGDSANASCAVLVAGKSWA